MSGDQERRRSTGIGGSIAASGAGEQPELPPALDQRARRAFATLSRDHQQMLLMLQVEKLTYAQVADRLGISRAAVEARAACTIIAWASAMERQERPRFGCLRRLLARTCGRRW